MNFHNITHDDMNNGDGLRVVLWVAGCEHHCKNCQNPITWDFTDGVEFDKAAFHEICTELSKPYISGLTLSGGDPLHPVNRCQILWLVKKVKQFFPHKTIWLYTGYTWEEIKDVGYHWAGSTNQRVINVPQSLKEGRVILHESN